MTKSEFINKFKSLSPQEKKDVINYYNDILKSAIFIDTFEQAEQRLLWIREALYNV